jgi:hypothetical protein
MKKILFLQMSCVAAALFLSFQCYAQTVSSSVLIKGARQYDGKSVTYRGEVIGDIMGRGEYAWLSINDGLNAIGVWINKELIKDIQYVGNYRAKGDVVEITGIFKCSCPEHGGDLDIHAQYITKVGSGEPSPRPMDLKKAYLAFLLSIVTISTSLLGKFI